jgi:hypothetical protein
MIERTFGVKNKKIRFDTMKSMGEPNDNIKTKNTKKLIFATSIVHYYLTSADLHNKDLGLLGLHFKMVFFKNLNLFLIFF